jgi:hypothetical protein
MPKPLKKPAKKRAKRPSWDPNTRAKQSMTEHMAKVEVTNAPWQAETALPPAVPFAEQLSAHMRALGAKGGKIGGKRRMETMTEKERKAVAMKAAAARWAKKRTR